MEGGKRKVVWKEERVRYCRRRKERGIVEGGKRKVVWKEEREK